MLEIQAGPYGPRKPERAVVVTTDPETLPELNTWYLVTNLPLTNKPRATRGPRTGASLEEVVRLYGLRNWVEQSYKQVKSTLGWARHPAALDPGLLRVHILLVASRPICGHSPVAWRSSASAEAQPHNRAAAGRKKATSEPGHCSASPGPTRSGKCEVG